MYVCRYIYIYVYIYIYIYRERCVEREGERERYTDTVNKYILELGGVRVRESPQKAENALQEV